MGAGGPLPPRRSSPGPPEAAGDRETTGIQQREISRIEAAHANPTVGTVSTLARALGAEVRLVAARKRTPTSRVVARRAAASSARVVRRSR